MYVGDKDIGMLLVLIISIFAQLAVYDFYIA